MRGIIGIALAIGMLMAAASAYAGVPKDLEPLAFLLGEWEASGGGKPGEAVGSAAFARGLQDRVIIRSSYSEYPASARAVAVAGPGEVSFVSEIASGAPRFRLSYKLGSDGVLKGEFAMAPPGKPEAFARYLAWESLKSETEKGRLITLYKKLCGGLP